jgi:integrase/recombinase XerC
MTVELIAQYERHLRDLRRATSTITAYVDVLTRADRELPVGLLSACTDELAEWIYTDDRSRATRSQYRTIIAGFFAWACDPDDPVLDYDPARRLPKVRVPRGRPRPVAPGQQLDILTRAQRPFRDWFVICLYAGARCIEVAQLDREDITQDSVLLKGKGDMNRYVPTHPMVWELARQLPRGPVAVDQDGSRLDRRQISHRGNYHLSSALGYRGVSMHRLRHTFLTGAYDACKDIRAVQALAGHASVATTQVYVAVSEATMRSAVASLR